MVKEYFLFWNNEQNCNKCFNELMIEIQINLIITKYTLHPATNKKSFIKLFLKTKQISFYLNLSPFVSKYVLQHLWLYDYLAKPVIF